MFRYKHQIPIDSIDKNNRRYLRCDFRETRYTYSYDKDINPLFAYLVKNYSAKEIIKRYNNFVNFGERRRNRNVIRKIFGDLDCLFSRYWKNILKRYGDYNPSVIYRQLGIITEDEINEAI